MAKLTNVTILLLAFFTAMFLQSAEAENYTVGGSTGWTSSPPNGSSFYSKWAANFTFKENDTLVFNFATGRHVVAILTKANFDNCNVSSPIQVLSTGPARVTLNRTGEFYFACAFTGHCSSGQKLSVNVTGSSSSPAPAKGPSPPASGSPSPPSSEGAPNSSPTGAAATTPPPQGSGSAASLAATFSLVLITIAVNLVLHF